MDLFSFLLLCGKKSEFGLLLAYSFGRFGVKRAGHFLVAWVGVRVGKEASALAFNVMKQNPFLDH